VAFALGSGEFSAKKIEDRCPIPQPCQKIVGGLLPQGFPGGDEFGLEAENAKACSEPDL